MQIILLQVEASEQKEAEQKPEEPAAEAEAETEQPATLKKAQIAAAARKDGEDVGSSGQLQNRSFAQWLK